MGTISTPKGLRRIKPQSVNHQLGIMSVATGICAAMMLLMAIANANIERDLPPRTAALRECLNQADGTGNITRECQVFLTMEGLR